MSGCCDPSGYRKVFNTKGSIRAARAYRRKGLDRTARAMVDALAARLPGAVVLEGGSGTGVSHVEMLGSGAARAISVDLSDAYIPAAQVIAEDHGVADRIERHVGDFVTLAPELPEADVVFLNRVVCCYPDMPAMVAAASDRSRGVVAISYPRNRWFVRWGIAALNRYLRWRSVGFQVFVHDPQAIDRLFLAGGFCPAGGGRTFTWHWRLWETAEPR